MDLDLLRVFLRIAETGSFSKAAEELYVSQSALTKQMKRLERELQVLLFDRSGRNISPTHAGKELQKQAPAFLNAYEDLKQAVCPIGKRLRIGVFPILEYYGIAGDLSEFSKSHPQIPLVLEEAENAVLPGKLENGDFDAVIMRYEGEKRAGWKYLPLLSDELALVIPVSHPLARKQEVSLAEFADQKFILLSKATHLYDCCLHACHQAGFEPHVFYTGSSAESIVRLVQEGAGIAIFMRQVALQSCPAELAVLRFQETASSEIVLAFSEESYSVPEIKQLWSFLSKKSSI